MPKLYKYKDTTYNNIYGLQEALAKENTFISSQCKEEQLKELGVEVEEVPEDLAVLKQRKLQLVEMWTASKITGGFTSECSGVSTKYDSDKDTQLTMQGIAVNADKVDEVYPTGVPVRGYVAEDTTKTIQYLKGEQVLKFCADLALHIGVCKTKGWELQSKINNATSSEELEAVVFE